MTRHETMMMGLYLVVIAVGAIMVEQSPFLGIAQICIGAFFFALRLKLILNRR